MNCPACKSPNPSGVTYCEMCYEPFHHSAAETYLRTVRRERMMEERLKDEPSAKMPDVFGRATELAHQVNWRGLGQRAQDLARRNVAAGLVLTGLVIVGLSYFVISSLGVGFKLYGARLEYDFPSRGPLKNLISFRTDLKSWSERQGRLDTPLEQMRIDEIGNVQLVAEKKDRGQKAVHVKATEWIRIIQDKEGTASRLIPQTHPSLLPVARLLDKHGRLLPHSTPLSPRLAKGAVFVMPAFPEGAVRRNRSWTENMQWVEMNGDWKVFWSGDLKFRLVGQRPCGKQTCQQIVYSGALRPQLWAGPAWSTGGYKKLRFAGGPGVGEILFDSSDGRVVSNSFDYGGMLRFPIRNLDEIPDEMRIGRYVRGPGEIALEIHNRIDVRIP